MITPEEEYAIEIMFDLFNEPDGSLTAYDPDDCLDCGMFCSLRADPDFDELDNLLSYKYAMETITLEAIQ